ncbi:Cu-Zn family superoxide dismutase [Sphingobium sp. B1D7B]|uniref:superoxide dismutase family protein n=1 Tax=unclassified Sphingobium TaxID=2611147 RepID=UPI002224FA7B|nr:MULTISPECIES: superoxide dismutase family protein [unclassified Sphingobium]MCW2350816.1 Cu-Zn family superoxide dismutase [Sphingobium sp. B12D2B]MCW2369920.1 Cu-Zn family superoxide dismutase [Sphingobium sp. B11D3D]MCW2405482.1 Cu-Zn family superoxide dismutase [Sphingobium sp. B1D7B]MCW2411705.1 Cu-Zn family superoxide dismutase [Sphingobium sp. B8D3D]MCW2416001.1 Cu-Zn family superoxide dismutase [Sphingobium sp. B8D3A]
MTARIYAVAAIATLGLAACSSPDHTQNNAVPADNVADNAMMGNATGNMASGESATATLQTAQGAPAGTATIRAMDGGLQIMLALQGLPSGSKGVHVHMTGKCDAPDFTTAGGHWNPASTKHGLENPQGQHAGDMPNIDIGEDGRGTLEYTLKGATMAGLMDTDGSAIVVHEGTDDQRTDPSGDSGGRIACGVFQAGA